MRGLYDKYQVVRSATGAALPRGSCFVLVPDKDPSARVALAAYAEATDNAALARDIRDWLDALRLDRSGMAVPPQDGCAGAGRHARPGEHR